MLNEDVLIFYSNHHIIERTSLGLVQILEFEMC